MDGTPRNSSNGSLPAGIVLVPTHGRLEALMIREVHTAPLLTVMDEHGETWLVPARGYQQASQEQIDRFWSNLERNLRQQCAREVN